jgi:uncharacterized protein YndB with AHSA1/START domain
MRLDISMEELFPVPLERVWHALTDSQMINRWLMATDDFQAKVGARFFARRDPGHDPRHVDFMWPLWSVLDRTREGRGSAWGPRLEYS